MQHQEQNELPEDFAPLSGTTTSPQSQPQNNPQYTYYYPQNLQASQNQGMTVTPQQQIYYPSQRNAEQQARQAAHNPATPGTQPTYYKNQPGGKVVAHGNTEFQIDWLSREQNWIPHNSHRAALEQQEKERSERFGRQPGVERRTGKDRRANKSRKLYIMTIIAAFLALVILIAGFFAVFYQVSINNRLSDQENTADITYKASVRQIVPPIDTKVSAPQITRDQETSRKPAPRVAPQTSGGSDTRRGIASTNKIIMTSDPSGALISTNGKTLGRTPFTWHNPAVYGMMVFTLEKHGYLRERQKVEFTGGTLRTNFVLTEVQAGGREAAPVFQEQILQPVLQEKIIEPVVAPTLPVPASSARAKPSTPRGPRGVIFISSLPPNADVYLNGRWIGITNTDLTINAGTHQVTLVKDGKQLVKTLTVAAGKNPSQVWRLR